VSQRRFATLTLALIPLAACGCAGSHARPFHRSAIVNAAEFGDYDNDEHGGPVDGDKDTIKGPRDGDNDLDNPTKSYYDGDDGSVRLYGQEADPADTQAVSALVARYYDAAASENGSAACALLYRKIADTVAEVYGRPPGQAFLQGTTCAAVMRKAFVQFHNQLSAYHARLEVDAVRVSGGHGIAVLRFAGLPGRQIEVRREHKTWRIDDLLDRELP
jgi:hypothetical protein